MGSLPQGIGFGRVKPVQVRRDARRPRLMAVVVACGFAALLGLLAWQVLRKPEADVRTVSAAPAVFHSLAGT